MEQRESQIRQAGEVRLGRVRSRVSGGPRTDFERQVALDMPSMVGLARRLVTDTLKRDEREQVARTEKFLELVEQGWNATQIAPEVGMSPHALHQWTGRARFRVFSMWVKERTLRPDDKTKLVRASTERARFEALGPKALDFLEDAFRRDAAGKYLDRREAKWATEMVAKGKGWTEPELARRDVGELKVSVVVAQQTAIRASDAARGSPVTIEVTATPVGGEELPPMAPELLDDESDDEPTESDAGGEHPDEPAKGMLTPHVS